MGHWLDDLALRIARSGPRSDPVPARRRFAVTRRGALAAGAAFAGGVVASSGPFKGLGQSLAIAAGEDPVCLRQCLAEAEATYQQEVKSACASGFGGHADDVADGEVGFSLGCQMRTYFRWQHNQDACHQNCCASGHNCDGICTDVSRDDRNCGACGKACVSPSKCCQGHCTTQPCLDCAQQIKQQLGTSAPPPAVLKWYVNCNLPRGGQNPPGCQCIQVCADSQNCGSCGNVCGAQGGTTGRCVDGKCVYDSSTYDFCSADPNHIWGTTPAEVPGKPC